MEMDGSIAIWRGDSDRLCQEGWAKDLPMQACLIEWGKLPLR